jgi:hypothetical protein
VFSINSGEYPYRIKGQERSESLQRPWEEHRASMAIDAPTANVEKLREEKTLGDVCKLLLVYALKS